LDTQLVKLDREHPGFRDPHYRARRDAIARIALDHRPGEPVPEAPYTSEEDNVWRAIFEVLSPLHEEWVCRELNEVQAAMALSRTRIPQLPWINEVLQPISGFAMIPAAGLATPRTFLEGLAAGQFLSTQYIRHHSRPLYTPEPDVVHELIGHAASLTHPDIVALSRAFGEAAKRAGEVSILRLIQSYWYTLEFGAVEEDGKLKSYGAGLLSSAGELSRFATETDLRPWDLDRIADTPFDPTNYQPQIYVAPSFRRMVNDLHDWLESVRH
jgi:phenylalanine-4-hydroxylase